METFLALCAPFGPLGAHLEVPGGKKSVPKASEGDFEDLVKPSMFMCVFVGFLELRATREGSKSSPGAPF